MSRGTKLLTYMVNNAEAFGPTQSFWIFMEGSLCKHSLHTDSLAIYSTYLQPPNHVDGYPGNQPKSCSNPGIHPESPVRPKILLSHRKFQGFWSPVSDIPFTQELTKVLGAVSGTESRDQYTHFVLYHIRLLALVPQGQPGAS